MVNLKLLAVKIGDELKYDTTVKEIDRIAEAIFDFDCLEFPNDDITSDRAKTVYDWVMTLEKQPLIEEHKLYLLKEFVEGLTLENHPARNLIYENISKTCKECKKKLRKSIVDLKAAAVYLVNGEWGDEFEHQYIHSYNSIELCIAVLNELCELDLTHDNGYGDADTFMTLVFSNVISKKNVGTKLNEWYDPLENSIKNSNQDKSPTILQVNETEFERNNPLENSIQSIKTGKNEETLKQQINQNFYGNVGNIATGDINNYNINLYLNALEKVIEDSDSIPPEEKKNLIGKIRDVAKNPYVSSISSSLIVEAIKALSTGVKPF
jgi:hypothetical protein